MPEALGQQFLDFVFRHWLLASAFGLVMILLFVEEWRQAAGRGQTLSSQELTAKINHSQVHIIDLREASAFRDGHIINATHIAAKDIERSAKQLEKMKNQTVVLVDEKGTEALTIARQLIKQGFSEVIALSGGMAAWRKEGMPVVRGKS